MKGFFVTGTDTGIGKTVVSCGLISGFAEKGLKVVGMKPVAAGAEPGPAGEMYEDVVRLASVSNLAAPQDWINPYRFSEPIAPHIAAERSGMVIDMSVLETAYHQLCGIADRVIVEGAGGFRVPLGPEQGFDSLAQRLALPVILVVGMRLGCINHALLTADAVASKGLRLAGWVANVVDPEMRVMQDNIDSLRDRLPAPLLGTVPWMKGVAEPWQEAKKFLSISVLDAHS